jgi:hypothetical protein
MTSLVIFQRSYGVLFSAVYLAISISSLTWQAHSTVNLCAVVSPSVVLCHLGSLTVGCGEALKQRSVNSINAA